MTGAHLAEIDTLSVRGAGLTALKADDFSGLIDLKYLRLYNNDLSSLPDGLFDGLTALTGLHLGQNQFTEIPPQLFNIANLEALYLHSL